MVGAIIIGIVVWSFFRNNRNAVHSDLSASSHFGLLQVLPVLIYWIVVFICWVVLLNNSVIPSQVLFLFALLLISPSILSYLTAQFGLVKTSYFLGRLSYIVFKRNPHSGGLLRGLTAVYRVKNETRKRDALLWLKNRFLNHRGKVYSGDIVVYTIVDCQLNRPNDIEHLAHQLRKLMGIGKESIPKAISCYAFCCAAAPSIAKDDWPELFRIAYQWDTPAKNRFALFVKEFSGAYIYKKEAYSKLETIYHRLFCIYVPVFFSLPKRYEVFLAKQQPEKTYSYDISEFLKRESLSTEQVTKFCEVLMSDAQKETWMARAQELGSWQPDVSWGKIEQSIKAQLANKTKTNDIAVQTNEDYHEVIDRHCKSLVYISQSINLRLKSKNIGSGVENFLEWKKVRHILEELESDPQAHLSAFISIENTVWNWIADLWNISKEHCLVHYICKYCIPLAEQTGNTEFFRVMTGLTGDKFP